MKCTSGIILPLRHFNSKKYGEKASMINVFDMNNSPPGNYNKNAFPFNVPFFTGEDQGDVEIIKNNKSAVDLPEYRKAIIRGLKIGMTNIYQSGYGINIDTVNLKRMLRSIRSLNMISYNTNDRQITINVKLGGIKNDKIC